MDQQRADAHDMRAIVEWLSLHLMSADRTSLSHDMRAIVEWLSVHLMSADRMSLTHLEHRSQLPQCVDCSCGRGCTCFEERINNARVQWSWEDKLVPTQTRNGNATENGYWKWSDKKRKCNREWTLEVVRQQQRKSCNWYHLWLQWACTHSFSLQNETSHVHDSVALWSISLCSDWKINELIWFDFAFCEWIDIWWLKHLQCQCESGDRKDRG